jgi:hypothetical protein
MWPFLLNVAVSTKSVEVTDVCETVPFFPKWDVLQYDFHSSQNGMFSDTTSIFPPRTAIVPFSES